MFPWSILPASAFSLGISSAAWVFCAFSNPQQISLLSTSLTSPPAELYFTIVTASAGEDTKYRPPSVCFKPCWPEINDPKRCFVNTADASRFVPSQEEAGKVSSHTFCPCPVHTQGFVVCAAQAPGQCSLMQMGPFPGY